MNKKGMVLMFCFLILNLSFITAGIDDGLVSYFKLNSNTIDNSNLSYSGIVQGDVAWTEGHINDGAGFAGSNDYIKIGDATKYSDLCVNGCTIAAWINPYLAHTGTIVGRWDSTDNNYFFSLKTNVNNRPMFSLSEAGSSICYSFSKWGNNLIYNQWNFVVGVYNKTTLLTYIGSNIANPGISSGCNLQGINSVAWQDSEATFIGVEDDGGLFNDFNGIIDEVRMYSRVLTQEEIEELYAYTGELPAPPVCGDGVINGVEVCDGDLLNSQTCSNFGFDSGTLSCNSECTGYDLSQCFNQPVCNTCSQCDSIFDTCTEQKCHNDCGSECYYRGEIPLFEDCISLTDACSEITQCSDYSNYECGNNPCNLNCTWDGVTCEEKICSAEICNDNLDNDCDLFSDCDDSDCVSDVNCISKDLQTYFKEINFGAVLLNENKDITFVMNNTGDDVISGIITINFPFSIVSGETYSLQPGAIHNAVIRFSPVSEGHFSNKLILSNSQGISLRAYGNGVTDLSNQKLNLPSSITPRFTITDKVWPSNHGDSNVCLWGDDKMAAVSISIDDNYVKEHDWWINQTQQRGNWSMTWFVITGLVGGKSFAQYGRWTDFQRLVNLGYDIQSHTANHTNIEATNLTEEQLAYQYSRALEDINENIPGYRATTIAYPYCNGNESISSRYHAASRSCSGFPDAVNKVNYSAVLTVSNLVPPWTNFKGNWIEKLIYPNTTYVRYYRGWLNLFKHTYQGYPKDGGVITLSELDILSQYKDDLWIDSFTAIALYGQERDTHTLHVYDVTDNSIKFTLTDLMDDSVFTIPLTVKIRINNNWNAVTAIQSGEIIPISFVEYNGNKYILVKAVPDRGEIILTKRTI